MDTIFKYIIQIYIRNDKKFLHNPRLFISFGLNLKYNRNIFLVVCFDSNLPFIKYLIRNNADIHECDDYALRWASS